MRYAGSKDFIYLSYTSADCYDIFGLIELLENRYRFWFASDVEEGEKLPDDVLERIENCHVFLFFATECSVLSQQCREEIAFALDRGKDIIVVLYEDAELTEELAQMLHSAKFIRVEESYDFFDVLNAEEINACNAGRNASSEELQDFFANLIPERVVNAFSDDEDDEDEPDDEPGEDEVDDFDEDLISDPEELYERGMQYRMNGDYSRAKEYFRKAAVLGNAAAQFEMGEYCYTASMLSFGMDYSYVEWYSLSAMQGYSHAEFRMGECYRDGRGVARDYEKAAYWFGRAAAQGNKTAKRELKSMKRQGMI